MILLGVETFPVGLAVLPPEQMPRAPTTFRPSSSPFHPASACVLEHLRLSYY